jgi:serine/threonine protein kinase
MLTSLFTCFGTIVGLVGAILLVIYVVVPVFCHSFRFIGRLVRFMFQELRDCILLPIALFVGVIKLLRALLCVVLARWDIVHKEMEAARRRFTEAYDRIISLFIENPLGIIGIKTKPPHLVSRVTPANTALNIFEGYKIIGTLPSGGSGAKIYIANKVSDNTTVVLKNFEIASGSQLPQIVRESRAMESAKKLGLVLEHHLDNDRFWYAMPYHAGDHLGVVTNALHKKSKKLSEPQFQTILSYQQTLLHTLREYHEAGLWHKDVKPDNIIIHDGSAHLVDLGLVTPLASAMTLTTHGTEYFRDPELVRQAMRGVKVHQADGSKFDVFAAGAVLYFMLENTFPAHGGLSDFSKESPECIRWIVRRAMADYDKRYCSIDEMLLDVETILSAKHIAGVRPADLPSMGGQPTAPKESVRRLPPKSTPSTGGGPFGIRVYVYKTKPLGLIFLLLAVATGAFVLYENKTIEPEIVQEITAITIPNGRVLVVNEMTTTQDEAMRKNASNKVAELGVAGWELFMDADKEAKVRSWLPAIPTSASISATKFEHEGISGIVLIKEGVDSAPLLFFVDQNGSHPIP